MKWKIGVGKNSDKNCKNADTILKLRKQAQ